jgi:hypothetical protein
MPNRSGLQNRHRLTDCHDRGNVSNDLGRSPTRAAIAAPVLGGGSTRFGTSRPAQFAPPHPRDSSKEPRTRTAGRERGMATNGPAVPKRVPHPVGRQFRLAPGWAIPFWHSFPANRARPGAGADGPKPRASRSCLVLEALRHSYLHSKHCLCRCHGVLANAPSPPLAGMAAE